MHKCNLRFEQLPKSVSSGRFLRMNRGLLKNWTTVSPLLIARTQGQVGGEGWVSIIFQLLLEEEAQWAGHLFITGITYRGAFGVSTSLDCGTTRRGPSQTQGEHETPHRKARIQTQDLLSERN